MYLFKLKENARFKAMYELYCKAVRDEYDMETDAVPQHMYDEQRGFVFGLEVSMNTLFDVSYVEMGQWKDSIRLAYICGY